MSSMIKTVFKTLALCIVIFIAAEITIQAIDRVVMTNRLNNLSESMIEQLRAHNSIPDAIAPMFQAEIDSIVERSLSTSSITWNFDTPITATGSSTEIYPPINSANAVDYGEKVYLVFEIKYHLKSILFSPDKGTSRGISVITSPEITYHKVSSTIGLRYLK